MLYEWNGVGDSSVHSSDVAVCAPTANSGVDVKNDGSAHGFAPTTLPFTYRS